MKALLYQGPRDIRCESMDDAKLQTDRDIVVKMEACAICGSDLHIYHGEGFSEDLGYCVGHEAVGEVVETGREVRRVKTGDKVMISAAVGCGACRPCLGGDVLHCETGGAGCYGLSAKLQGCQAEAIRVPAADFNVAKIPDGVTMDQALMMTDSLATAWYGLRNADIKPGGVVVVVGLGPIGLMGVEGAFVLGASTVYAIDLVPERRAIAEGLGAIPLHPDDAFQIIQEQTSGRMADSALEAVGADVTIRLAISLVGREKTVSVIGVNQSRKFDFPMGRAFAKALTFRIGTCSVPKFWPELIPLVQQGRLHPEKFISHRMKLSEGAEAYRVFDAREAGTLKTIMTP